MPVFVNSPFLSCFSSFRRRECDFATLLTYDSIRRWSKKRCEIQGRCANKTVGKSGTSWSSIVSRGCEPCPDARVRQKIRFERQRVLARFAFLGVAFCGDVPQPFFRLLASCRLVARTLSFVPSLLSGTGQGRSSWCLHRGLQRYVDTNPQTESSQRQEPP